MLLCSGPDFLDSSRLMALHDRCQRRWDLRNGGFATINEGRTVRVIRGSGLESRAELKPVECTRMDVFSQKPALRRCWLAGNDHGPNGTLALDR